MRRKRELPVPSSRLSRSRQGFSQPCFVESRIRSSRKAFKLGAATFKLTDNQGSPPTHPTKNPKCRRNEDARTTKSISSFFNAATAGSLCGFTGTLSAISRYPSSSLPLEYEKPSLYYIRIVYINAKRKRDQGRSGENQSASDQNRHDEEDRRGRRTLTMTSGSGRPLRRDIEYVEGNRRWWEGSGGRGERQK